MCYHRRSKSISTQTTRDNRVFVGNNKQNHKGINAPGINLSMPFISEKDYADIKFGCENGVDAFALSFVRTAEDVMNEKGVNLEYHVGTMIEIPRAAITADEIAKEAEFFSFGTNDLTQMTYGFSRDDTGKIIEEYVNKGILEEDPFQTLDIKGVGQLVKTAAVLGKQARPKIKLGICGEHGGDPKTIEFCNEIGLNYVSCSPYRVPIARLAAAQAVVKSKQN